jgi:hypothetical protein
MRGWANRAKPGVSACQPDPYRSFLQRLPGMPGGQRVFDAGPPRRARLLEGLGLLNIVLQSSLTKPWMSSVKIVD